MAVPFSAHGDPAFRRTKVPSFRMFAAFNSRAGALLLAVLSTTPIRSLFVPAIESARGAEPGITWDERTAEHLINRAGFGATTKEIKELAAIGRDAAIERLFPDPSKTPKPEILAKTSLHGGLPSPEDRHATVEARREGFLSSNPTSSRRSTVMAIGGSSA